MTTLPWVVTVHVLGGLLFFAVIAFTRLGHAVIWPMAYLWRTHRVVVWNRELTRTSSEEARRN